MLTRMDLMFVQLNLYHGIYGSDHRSLNNL